MEKQTMHFNIDINYDIQYLRKNIQAIFRGKRQHLATDCGVYELHTHQKSIATAL